MSSYNPFNSTIFNKVIMAGTGVILVLFVIGHMVGNLQVFLGRDVFNTYAHFLKSTGELLWIMRLVLLLCVVLHIYTSLKLKFLNMNARPDGYSVTSYDRSTLYSRTMIYSGIMIFLFVVYHLLHFTALVTNPEYADYSENYGPVLQSSGVIDHSGNIIQVTEGEGIFDRHDAYKMVIAGFNKPIVAIVYILAVLFLALHLSHAIQSMFQTLGWSGPKTTPRLVLVSKLIGWGLFIGFASIPVSVLIFGLGKGVIG